MTLLAVRFIDLAIFGTLGSLWIGGALFIVVLYRWILRFEGGTPPSEAHEPPAPENTPTFDDGPRTPTIVLSPAAASYGALHS